MIKKLVSLAVCIAMAGTVFTGCQTKKADSNEIQIGAVLPLSGDIAALGQSSKNALQLLEEQVNSKGGVLGKKVKFIIEDDENKPANSANVAQKLITQKVVGIVGSYSSKCSIAMGPVVNSAKLPMITGTSTNPKVTEAGEYVFRACFIDPFQGTVIAKFASEDLKAKTAAVLYDVGNDYSKGLAEFFQDGFKKAGGNVVGVETYANGDQDFNAQLTKIKALNPDVLVLPDMYSNVGLITKQARALGIKSVFLGGDGWDSPDLFKIGGDSVNGSYFANHFSPDDTAPAVVQFNKDYKAKFNSTPDATSGLTYDAGSLLIKAIEKAGSTEPDKIKDAMKSLSVDVVSGKVSFDEKRNPVKSAVMIKVEDGKQTFVKKVNP
ncbi:ABC transporter substrate-binding protein [Clostridium magnum]|uniref:Leucine-, isoleucine-, valine-, threonine-, and alanine-binding protein n=1 Tax=Clostridium magnum DSM 2767 TaxID=1121326 RepID=A0A162TZK3_9CLOT|nr:ABC transporter substrate-binding protein [Clostridium magnum]KZL93257.1 leucine-, isoleucine-, valine-, threonine-, and alanine-binding protein precursor [Clostridium magnum DSM 2767]SHI19170.1 amino acid/amide ABC transporter substrate-binding protein, HAAT family (TC 3.A.1.4.-) [Clostridium magnum DSM 2767]